jgi:(1->4)-alpha-D-glucan 1-alpha-D-glucosylmutase
VDPDNRRPVDYSTRRRYLADIRSKLNDRRALLGELLDTYADGRIKMYVLHVALSLRREKPELFSRGDYRALSGDEHAVAFTRAFEGERVICCVPRLSHRLNGERAQFPLGKLWGERMLDGVEPGIYEDALSGSRRELAAKVPLAEVFADCPVALLVKAKAQAAS